MVVSLQEQFTSRLESKLDHVDAVFDTTGCVVIALLKAPNVNYPCRVFPSEAKKSFAIIKEGGSCVTIAGTPSEESFKTTDWNVRKLLAPCCVAASASPIPLRFRCSRAAASCAASTA
jgi:hypothetical protein